MGVSCHHDNHIYTYQTFKGMAEHTDNVSTEQL